MVIGPTSYWAVKTWLCGYQGCLWFESVWTKMKRGEPCFTQIGNDRDIRWYIYDLIYMLYPYHSLWITWLITSSNDRDLILNRTGNPGIFLLDAWDDMGQQDGVTDHQEINQKDPRIPGEVPKYIWRDVVCNIVSGWYNYS